MDSANRLEVRTIGLFVLSSLCVGGAPANSEVDSVNGSVTIDTRYEVDGRELWKCIARSKLDSSRWDASMGEPSTSVGEAFRTAELALRSVVMNSDEWKCDDVRLVHYGDGQWLWDVMFTNARSNEYCVVSVYLDGECAVMGSDRTETRRRAQKKHVKGHTESGSRRR